MDKIDFKYRAEEAAKIIETFASDNSFPFEKRIFNGGMLWKYFLTTGDENETVIDVYLKANGDSSSIFMEKGQARIIHGIIEYARQETKCESRVGIDEAGKGDYFGPLVIAAAGVEGHNEIELLTSGVGDSKLISDRSVIKIADKVKATCKYDVIAICPTKYNELYDKFRNLNRLLAWGHARALENVLQKGNFKVAISDKFSMKDELRRALFEKGKNVDLRERHRAESDVAVAAASILARAEFLTSLDELSKRSGIKLPKGCSNAVFAPGREIIDKLGREQLGMYAKLHFKTTQYVIQPDLME